MAFRSESHSRVVPPEVHRFPEAATIPGCLGNSQPMIYLPNLTDVAIVVFGGSSDGLHLHFRHVPH